MVVGADRHQCLECQTTLEGLLVYVWHKTVLCESAVIPLPTPDDYQKLVDAKIVQETAIKQLDESDQQTQELQVQCRWNLH